MTVPEPCPHDLASPALSEHLSAVRAARGLLDPGGEVVVGDLWAVNGRRLRVLDVGPNNARVDDDGRATYVALHAILRGSLIERAS